MARRGLHGIFATVMSVELHRPYGIESVPPGYCVLVDRLWPRGIRKVDLMVDEWAKHLAPSTDLRKWFAHDLGRWNEFKARYLVELESQESELRRLRAIADAGKLILIYSARDSTHNQAAVLKELLDSLV